MAGECLRLLTWNVNGLHARFADLHSYVLTRRPDVVALQEVGPRVSEMWGYDLYVLDGAAGSTQEMVTYIRQGTVIAFEEMGINEGVEYITVSLLYLGENSFL